MVERYPKRLIEVDLPIKRISAHARREKSIRHGHISTLHIWWARRPLGACRAVVCAALWPDPADALCPAEFRATAQNLMLAWATQHLHKVKDTLSEESSRRLLAIQKNPAQLEDNGELRNVLLDFIADFASWDNSIVPEFLFTSQALTLAAHQGCGGVPGTRPLVVDPFAGGGSIPLEGLRIGTDVFASDLNPVAVVLNKVLIEYVPKYGQRLADEVRKSGQWVRDQAEKELSRLYPKHSDGSRPTAYLWARTIVCEGPACGSEVPLLRSPWLRKKAGKAVALRLTPNRKAKRVDIQVIECPSVRDIGQGTVRRGSVTCPSCGFTTPVESVRNQLKLRHGGASDARLLAVCRDSGFRAATAADEKAVRTSELMLDPEQVPSEPISPNELRRISVPLYGMTSWGDIFSTRQKVALSVFAKYVRQLDVAGDDPGFRAALIVCLALAVDRCADYWSSLAVWAGDFVAHTFGRQAIPFVTDFAEVQPFADASGNWAGAIDWIARVLARESAIHGAIGTVQMASASDHPLPDDSASAVITDPPYYDAVPYAYLSDFFYVWLRRMLLPVLPELMKYDAVPKAEEIVVDRAHSLSKSNKGLAFYEAALKRSFENARRILQPNGICVIVFASKTTASWEAILQSVIDSGFAITGSWPIDTERQARVSSVNQARLQSSVHLVCRPREQPSITENDIGDWRDVLSELPRRIHDWMPRLADEGVVGADAIFACLGPALEMFSRYSRVEKASGEVVSLREYLEQVWAAVAKQALAMVFQGADTTGFEADARLTAMWLWTLKAEDAEPAEEAEEDELTDESDRTESKAKVGGYVLEYDAARKIAQGLGASLESLANLVEIAGETARLLPAAERTRYLFGKDEAEAPVGGAQRKKASQIDMFAELTGSENSETVWKEKTIQRLGETTLDRVHQAMILFAASRGEALKRFLVEDGVGRDGRFWRLAQALSALFPPNSEEKRWVDGVLARKKGLGL